MKLPLWAEFVIFRLSANDLEQRRKQIEKEREKRKKWVVMKRDISPEDCGKIKRIIQKMKNAWCWKAKGKCSLQFSRIGVWTIAKNDSEQPRELDALDVEGGQYFLLVLSSDSMHMTFDIFNDPRLPWNKIETRIDLYRLEHKQVDIYSTRTMWKCQTKWSTSIQL